MSERKEPEPVSEFLRVLIARWEADGKRLYELAEAAGLARSMPSQIKARTSDASFYSARKFAKPFGYKDLPDLVSAAWTWWQSSDRSVIPTSEAESPRAEAMRLAHGYGVTHEQVERVLVRFPLPDYAHKDALWWLSRFHEERSLDAERAGAAKAEQHVAQRKKRGQRAIREAKERLDTKPPPPTRGRRAS